MVTRSTASAVPRPTRILGSCDDIRLCPLFFSRWMTRPPASTSTRVPDGVAGAASTNQVEANPMVPARCVVAKDRGGTILVADHQVEVAVVVEVSDSQAVAQVTALEIRSSTPVSQPEPPAGEVVVQQRRLPVAERLAQGFGIVVDVGVGHDAVGPAVVVEIRQDATPADPGKAVDRQTEVGRRIEEVSPPEVAVKRVVFVRRNW